MFPVVLRVVARVTTRSQSAVDDQFVVDALKLTAGNKHATVIENQCNLITRDPTSGLA
jgi:hypothetical protein